MNRTQQRYFGNLTLDPNRERRIVYYGRVSTEHDAQLDALENQMQWYEDQTKYHPNWTVVDRYIDEGITGTLAKKRPAFMRMIADAKKEQVRPYCYPRGLPVRPEHRRYLGDYPGAEGLWH